MIALTIRAGWLWATVEGDATLVGPDDPHSMIDDERLRLLPRRSHAAAGAPVVEWVQREAEDNRFCVVDASHG